MVRLLAVAAVIVGACEATSSSTYAKGSAYLVYAGPFSSSPSSAFGHLFLVLQPDTNVPLPYWDVVSFTVDAENRRPLRYLTIGVTGGFLGSYQSVKFHEKVRDYGVLEDRDLWLYRLNLSQPEWHQLLAVSRARTGVLYPYRFFSKNCASYIQELLNQINPSLPLPEGMVSPLEVVDATRKVGMVDHVSHRPALSSRLRAEARNMSPSFLRLLRSRSWSKTASDHNWLRQITPRQRAFTQDFLLWNTLHQKSALEPEVEEGLALIRMLNAQKQSPVTALTSVSLQSSANLFHRYGKLEAGNQYSAREGFRPYLGFRAGQHTRDDPWNGYRKVNTLELLAARISISSNGPRLDRAVLFSQSSLVPIDWLSSSASWMIEAVAVRGGVFGSEKLHTSIGGGLGRGLRVLDEGYAHVLFVGHLAAAQFGLPRLVPEAEAAVTWLGGKRWRAGVSCTFQIDAFRPSRKRASVESWVRRDLTHLAAIETEVAWDRDDPSLRLGFIWYP